MSTRRFDIQVIGAKGGVRFAYTAGMVLDLPADVQESLSPLFAALPLDEAMSQLVVREPGIPWASGATDLVEQVLAAPALAGRDALAAGLWLYVDQLDRSHDISQSMKNPTGSFWHGVMHRREGDFSNSHYWLRNTGRHPAMEAIDDYDGHAFIDEVAAAHRRGESPQSLIDMQRREWAALFEWCARQ